MYESHDGLALVIAPHNNFMTESHNLSTRALSFGPGGELPSLPPGFSQETIVVASSEGISSAVLAWGALARAVHSPPKPKCRTPP